MLTLVAGHADLPIIADWLRTHCRAVDAPDLPDTRRPD